MRHWCSLGWAAALLAGAAAGHAADMYVCTGSGGVEYRDDARAANCRKGVLAPVGAVSGDGVGKGRQDVPPAVPIAEERSNTDVRERLAAERKKLGELRREYNGGEPERRGGERNYARYQSRTAALKDAISQSEAAIAVLEQALQD
ncbi:hypothetical protein [Herbaspirillum chlorophenolicum]|uniref:hypothetical protein n=1 Tax=Herbaspirillum chlorophenolicum TaxID=211589 RepID=UPI00067C9446|nr:hypothetical protein [Herbaspirillum chlorophenolicum]